jgi:hypothetical protein
MTNSTRLQPCRFRTATEFILAVLLAGCGTEPSPQVSGAWSVTANYAGGGLTCMVLATLTLNGSGTSLSGSWAEDQATCTDNGTPLTLTPDTASIIGTVQGGKLSFTPQPAEGESPCALLNFEGQVTGEQISGSVRTTPVFCQGTYVQMNGTWQAQRP